MTFKFLFSLLIASIAVFISYLIMIPWITELLSVFSWFTWVILGGMVFIPFFYVVFVFATLFFKHIQNIKPKDICYPPLTILIAVYNEEKTILETIKSIIAQDYPNKIQLIVSDDGSEDRTCEIIDEFLDCYDGDISMTLIKHKKNCGKACVLNHALCHIKHDVVVTLDSDTTLFVNALKNIVREFLSDDFGAVAGAVRVNNDKKTFMTRLQKYDYLFGIASVKESQSLFKNTLVAQGAFSCFKRELLQKYGWCETVGEDIVLSWDMLKDGHKIGYADEAVAFTNVPETYWKFFKQRRRWSVGLIEAFKRNFALLFIPSFGQPYYWYNLSFIYIDLIYLFVFIPAVIAAIFFHFYLLAGWLTLLLIPLSILLNLLIVLLQYKASKKIGLKLKINLFYYILYLALYQILQTPATLCGYFSEIFGLKKKW